MFPTTTHVEVAGGVKCIHGISNETWGSEDETFM